MKKIFLIGGGEIKRKETKKIDKEVIKSSPKKNPKVLFIPTAASDNKNYISTFIQYYHSLGCKNIKAIKLISISTSIIKNKIKDSDIVYLGGGDPELLINNFKKKRLTNFFLNEINNNKILAGMSAGAMVIGEYFMNMNNLKVKRGFGILPNVLSYPHYKKEDSIKVLKIKKELPKVKIFAIPEKSAIYLINTKVYKKIGNSEIIKKET